MNDTTTLVFEVPLPTLTGSLGLYFAQEVWMTQPSLFGYVELGDFGIVRLWWDEGSGAFPYAGPRSTAESSQHIRHPTACRNVVAPRLCLANRFLRKIGGSPPTVQEDA